MKQRYLKVKAILFLSLSCLSLKAQTQKEQQLFTIEVTNQTVEYVLDYIESSSSYIFFYQNGTLDLQADISLKVKEVPIEKLLDVLFEDLGVEYEIKDRQIALKKAVKSSPVTSKIKTRSLTGKVTDFFSGEPVVGVGVILTDSKTGTVTDVDGNYFIEVNEHSEVMFSCLGYKVQTLIVGDLAVLNVRMEPDNEMMDEVVIVGAGTQRKVSVTGAITAIKGDALKSPNSSLTSNLAGKLSGVISSTVSGEPGAVSEFYIRGIGTFGGRTTPLILLDDIEISAADLNRLPAESIESFSILKDASATAIYGARGANGVMIVTTKKGAENTKTKINVSIENSFNQPVNRVEYVDGVTWMKLYNEALTTRTHSATPKYDPETDIVYTAAGINPYVFPNVDWYELLFRDFNMNQRANINMQGGGSKVTYYMGLQVNHDTGLLDVPKNYSFDNNIEDWSYIFQNNLSYKPTKTTKIDLHINAQFGNRQGPGNSTSSIFNAIYNANPVSFPAYFPAEEGDTHIRFGNSVLSGASLNLNPYAHMISSFSETDYTTINASLKLNQQLDFITKGLSVSVLVNFKNYSYSAYTNTLAPYYYRVMNDTWSYDVPDFFMTEEMVKGTDYIQQGTINRYTEKTFYFDARLNYSRRFGDHSISAMLMYMQREFRNDVLPNRNQGLSGRATYDWKNRYFAEFNFGYNGTERLARKDRYELFPALSVGWVPSNETFWSPLKDIVTHLKVRGSYGWVGSDETGLAAGAAHFLYKNEVTIQGGAHYQTGPNSNEVVDKNGPGFEKYAVVNASWERARKFDVGLDITLFDELSIVFDYFHDRRDRILQKRGSWPIMFGYSNAVPWSNVGKVDNQGYELSLNWKKELIPGMFIDIRGNFTYTKNRYEYMDEPDYPYVWQKKTEKPISALYGYIADGLFESEEDIRNSPSQKSLGSTVMPGDIKYRDITGDGSITTEDQIMLSEFGSLPRIQYGFGLNWSYKNIDFGVFFNGSAQRALMINGIAPFCSDDGNNDRNLMKFIADDYWSESNPNPNAQYPRLGVSNPQIANNMVPSSYWLRDGSFLRLKTIEAGYSFPHCRVYVTCNNVAVWSPFKLWDPELAWDAYPLQRIVNIGVQVNF